MVTPYEEWFFTARDPRTGTPYGTSMIYGACGGDGDRFAEAERVMEAAFEAGFKAVERAVDLSLPDVPAEVDRWISLLDDADGDADLEPEAD